MKKMYFYAAAAAMTLGMSLASCSKDDVEVPKGDATGGADIVNKGVEPANTVWPIAEQKAYLDEVGAKMQGKMNFDNLKVYTDMMNEFYSVVSNSNTDRISDWVTDTMDELAEIKGGNKMISTIGLSALQGHWTLSSSGYWRMEDANNLQFTANLSDGRPCTMSITPSGSKKKVHVMSDEEDGYTMDAYLEVPEHIKVVFTKNGTDMVVYDLDIDMSLSGDEFYPNKSGMAIKGTVSYANGYKMLVDRVAVSNSTYGSKISMVVDGETVAVFKSGAGLENLPSDALSKVQDEEMDIESATTNLTDFYASVDILGLVQMKMSVPDVNKFREVVDESKECNYSESRFKSCVDRMQSLFEGYVYFNGGTAKQAILRPVAKWDRYSSVWVTSMAVYMEDGTVVDIDSYLGNSIFKTFYEMLSDTMWGVI